MLACSYMSSANVRGNAGPQSNEFVSRQSTLNHQLALYPTVSYEQSLHVNSFASLTFNPVTCVKWRTALTFLKT